MKPDFKYFTHPGETLRKEIKESGFTTEKAAEYIGIARKNLSLIMNGHASITAGMAVRFAKAFNNTPQFWLNLQMQWDLSQINESELIVKQIR